jgi:hypothetical protein
VNTILYSYSFFGLFLIVVFLLFSSYRLVKSIKTYKKNKESVMFHIPKLYNPLAFIFLANLIFLASIIFYLNKDRSLLTDILCIIFVLVGLIGFNEIIMIPYFIKEGLVVNGSLFIWKELSIKDGYKDNQRITIKITKKLFFPKEITLAINKEDIKKLQENLKT